MRLIFKKFCIPLMLINNNIYTFLSGVIISLAVNVFSTLCVDKIIILDGWNLYCSFFLLLISGALFIYVASKVTSYQNYILSKNIVDSDKKKDVIMDFEGKFATKWVITHILLIITTLGGCALLLINYIL